jgi:hypothetical protein
MSDMQDIDWKLLELATLRPGITPKKAIESGKLPYTHGSVKQSAARLRRKELLWPSRPAWVLPTAKALEWLQDAKAHDDAVAETPVLRLTEHERLMIEAACKLAPIVQTDFLAHESLSDIPVSKRPQILITLREWGWLHPWNGLVKRSKE